MVKKDGETDTEPATITGSLEGVGNLTSVELSTPYDLRKKANEKEWVVFLRGLGVCLGALILFTHFFLPDSDPSPDTWSWVANELQKISLGSLLMLPWSRIRTRALWWVFFVALVVCVSAFLHRSVVALSVFYSIGPATFERVAPILISSLIFDFIIVAQIVAVWKIRGWGIPEAAPWEE